MAIKRIDISELLTCMHQHPVLDVRSPSEYQHAHIPGAISFPLFSDEERKEIGTAYKQQSRQVAVRIGLHYFSPKMIAFIDEVEKICKNFYGNTQQKTIIVHCWRGGMRSGAMAWLLDLYGFDVITIAGGYKAYRTWVLAQFEQPYNAVIVGGFTGTGKTKILQSLKAKNQNVIDLEGLASHRGSAFGNLGMPEQPSQEMYENKLAPELYKLSKNGAVIFLEDESQRIGSVNTPTVLFQQLRTKPVYYIQLSFEHRLENIIADYGSFEKERLLNAVERVSRKLGGLETKKAIEFLEQGDISSCFAILLKYYDRMYEKSMKQREGWDQLVEFIPAATNDADTIADTLIQYHQNKISL